MISHSRQSKPYIVTHSNDHSYVGLRLEWIVLDPEGTPVFGYFDRDAALECARRMNRGGQQ